MTKEQLMQSRVIVENKWPGCPYEVGDILVKDGNFYWVVGDISWFWKIDKSLIEPFPYLLRPLSWWEDRQQGDLPDYLKIKDKVYKIKRWESYLGWLPHEDNPDPLSDFKVAHHFDKGLPATEEEYQQFKKLQDAKK